MMIVTIAALVMAASLGWFAYRLMQDEQRRADARVALLTAALDEPTPPAWETPARAGQVGLVARPVAPPATPPGIPDLVYLDDDARPVHSFRSEHDGRTARPAGESSVEAWDSRSVTTHVDEADTTGDSTPTSLAASRSSGLFAAVPEPRRGDARGVIAVAGVVLVGVLATTYVWFGRPEPTTTPAGTAGTAATTAAAAPSVAGAATTGGMPLELLSLAHDQRNGTIVVRGLVRNPVSGSDRSGIVASVMLLDQAGGFLGSGRAPLETTRLRPGDDVGFAVELPSHKDVRRYRVTFRGVDGALVPHADRRGGRP